VKAKVLLPSPRLSVQSGDDYGATSCLGVELNRSRKNVRDQGDADAKPAVVPHRVQCLRPTEVPQPSGTEAGAAARW
jgi:hypothetical protein